MIIIGLGNPGKKYAQTRHNVGFAFVEHLKDAHHGDEFVHNKKLKAEVSTITTNGKKILLAKPDTFMNNSGASVLALLSFYKKSPDELIVIQDELDLRLGSWKNSHGKNAGGQNGISDIIGRIGTKNFTRIRIGIDNRSEQERQNIPGRDYVLSKFSSEEECVLSNIYSELETEVSNILSEGR